MRKLKWFDVEPKNVDGQRATRTIFYKDMLRKIVKGLFEIECPLEWDYDYVLNTLILNGYLVFTDTPAGVLALKGSITGYNYANSPTEAVIVVPTLPQMRRTIGVDCELLFMERTPFKTYFSFNEIIRVYAEKLASCDAAIDVNVINSKFAYIADAESRAQAETIKKIMDKISEGEPLVVYRKNSLSEKPLQLFFNNLKQNFIAGDMQDVKRTIMNEFLTLVGVNNANTDKKERLITSEADANLEELQCNMDLFRKNLNLCQQRIKKMFPELSFSIKLKFDGRTERSVVNDISRTGDNMEHKESN